MSSDRSRIGIARACVLALALLAAPRLVAAQPAAEPAAYRPLVEEAVAEYEASNFEEARSLFTKAIAIYPSARALRGLGMVEFELRNYGDSAADLERALASEAQPLQGELRAEAERLLTRARGFLARVNVSVEPASAIVSVDHRATQLGVDGSLLLELGDHLLEFQAAGYRPAERVLKVRGGEQLSLHILMRPEGSDAAPQDQTRPAIDLTASAQQRQADDDPRRPLYKNPWLWTGIGMVVAGAALGLGFGLRGRGGDDGAGYDGPRVIGP